LIIYIEFNYKLRVNYLHKTIILEPSFGRQRTRASKPISSTVPIDENVEVTSAAPKPNFAERYKLIF